jgi:GT2 family glycosyltransferase
VIIVSYNVLEYLCHCIDSIIAQKDIRVEIIVVDNNSTDATKDLIKSKYPAVKLICNSDNFGFSAANNQGIKIASSEIILLLNPDTELKEKGALQHAKKYLEGDPQIAILAPQLLNTDGSFQPSFWSFHAVKELMLELFYMHRMKQAMPPPSSSILVEAASGAALFFRRSLVDEIGGLDENMFWTEDIDFCYRATQTGKKVIWTPEIRIIHHGGKSSAGNESVTIPNQVMSKIKFSKKHDSVPMFFLVDILSLLFICSRLLVFTLVSFVRAKYNAKRKAYCIAFKAYFRFNFRGSSIIVK